MKHEFDILVAGAGMVGLTIALLLAQGATSDQLNISLIDAGGKPEFTPGQDVSLRVSAISSGTASLLARIGAWSAIADTRLCPFRDMAVWDASGSVEGPETLHFEAAEFAVPQLGYIVENILLQASLLAELDATNVSMNFATPVNSVKKCGHRYVVEYGEGKTMRPELIIAADGAASSVRNSAGITVKAWKYTQSAFVTHLQPESSHRNTAWQRFDTNGPVALLPLDDGRVSTVWTTTPEQADILSNAPDQQMESLLTKATDSVLGMLTAAGPRASFPLKSQHADRYVLDGLALVGDAAHAVHPLAGQGANLGLADAEALAHVIGEALAANEHPGDLPILRRYERDRMAANKTMLHFIDGLNRLFSNDSMPLARLRGTGMALFNRSGPIREHAVRVALGIR